MQVVIKLGSMIKNTIIEIDSDKNIFLVNKKTRQVDIKDFIDRLALIVASWEEKMINNSILDGCWYEVKLKEGKQMQCYEGRNAFPNNYYKFVELIQEVEKW